MSMKRLQPFRLSVLGLFAVLAAPSLHGAAVVLPNAADGTEGGSGLNTVLQNGPRTVQLQFAASLLAGVPVGSQFEGISFRLDGSQSTAQPSATYSYEEYKIVLAQAANSIADMSATFADNMVSPVAVFDGPLTITAASYPGGSTPNDWGATIAFDVPYAYQGGDLVVWITHPAASGGSGMFLDAMVGTADYRGLRNASTFNATTANIVSDGVTVMRLEFTPIPEPTTVATLAGLGLLGLTGWRRLRRAAATPIAGY